MLRHVVYASLLHFGVETALFLCDGDRHFSGNRGPHDATTRPALSPRRNADEYPFGQ
jgi:hypothetical protein